MSMTPKFTDPKDVFLILTTSFNFDPALTGISGQTQESNVFQFMSNYFNTNLNSFGKVFRKSNLLTEIDAINRSILNTKIETEVQMRQDVTTGGLNTFTVQFPNKIADPDDIFYRVDTDAFEYGGVVCRVKNRLGTNQLAIFDLDDEIVVDNVGSYDKDKGTVDFVGFQPTRLLSGDTFIRINVVPADDMTIQPLRNYILKLEENTSSATAIIDRQTETLEVN